MYQDLNLMFGWVGAKRDITKLISQYLNYQKVKSEHKRPTRLLQPQEFPVWKRDDIAIDFIMGIPLTKAGKDTLQVIMDRLIRSA